MIFATIPTGKRISPTSEVFLSRIGGWRCLFGMAMRYGDTGECSMRSRKMLSYLRTAFLRRGIEWRIVQSEAKPRQERPTRSGVRLSLEPLEDRLALSAVGSVDATSMIQNVPALVNLEQQFARNVAGFLTTEAQMVSSFSPPLSSLLQNEAQLILSFLPQSTTSSTTGIPQSAASSSTTHIHEYPIPPNNNMFPHPWT